MKKYYFLVTLIIAMFIFLVLVLVISARRSDDYFNPLVGCGLYLES